MQRLHIDYDHGGKQLAFYHTLNPEWLIHTGTHGNECCVIGSVERYLKANARRLPCFVWVPQVSPSAVHRTTRENANHIDLNRAFRDDATDPEAQANIALMRKWDSFDLFLSFHEDPDRKLEWYFYDTDDVFGGAWLSALLFAAAIDAGVAPYSGPDGTTNGAVIIKNGYFSEQWSGGGRTDEVHMGEAHNYAVRSGIAKRGVILEIPGKAAQDMKDKLVAVIFEHFIANAKPST